MSTRLETLCLDLLGLPAASRALIATKLLASLEEAEADPDAEKAWIEEVSRRLRDVEAGTVQMKPWAQALQDARARLK